MFSIAKFSTFTLCAIVLASASVKAHVHPRPNLYRAGITYEFGYNAVSDVQANPQKDLRLIEFKGDQSRYNITGDYKAKHLRSDAKCSYLGNPKDEKTLKFSGPCTTATQYARQLFTVTCKGDPMSNVTFELFPSGNEADENGHFAQAITYGNTQAAFIVDGNVGNMSKSTSPDEPLTSDDRNSGVFVSCVTLL